MKKTFLLLGATSLLAVLLSSGLNSLESACTEHWPWSVALLALLFTALGFFYATRKTTQDLVPALIGGFVGRFLFALIFLLTAFLILDTGFLALALHFMAHWLLFTLAEIAYLSGKPPRLSHRT